MYTQYTLVTARITILQYNETTLKDEGAVKQAGQKDSKRFRKKRGRGFPFCT